VSGYVREHPAGTVATLLGVIDPALDAADERLRRILAVTDAALVGMSQDELFGELLDRVRTLLEADIAAIMLKDPDANQLVTVAGIGLEAEVRQAFRVDIGTGFSGRVAATKAPVIIDAIGDDTVVSPILRNTGVKTLIGVPMLAGADLVGVLHLGTFSPRRFTEQDVALLQLVADRAAQANQVRQSHADRTAALALQRSLLPSRLPTVHGLDLAARYLPGHDLGVGGDWFDIFALPSGHLGAVVGDVSGHGLRAAVVMGRLRSALRAYALECDDPAEVLRRLDRKICHFEAGSLATIIYAMISPERDRIAISSAGHLPPIMIAPGKEPGLLTLPPDLPVGVGDTGPRRTTVVDVPPGATLVLYTDGLVERRGEVIDVGLDRLRGLVGPGPAEGVCASIVAGMDTRAVDDDIAVVTIRFIDDPPRGRADKRANKRSRTA
jgi:phosphoserine phosphatase RsbU/P